MAAAPSNQTKTRWKRDKNAEHDSTLFLTAQL
jgi:hypothetical protein